MTKRCNFRYTGDLVLGMHDALFEITGIIAGLTFAIENNRVIVMTGIIASVAASLSMAAANYMAQRTEDNPDAARCAMYTGIMYIGTSAAIIAPFVFIDNRFWALGAMGAIAITIIFLFNLVTRCASTRPFLVRFIEMLSVCTAVSGASFIIGILAKHFLGVDV